MLFIDGDHREEAIRLDLAAWSDKLAPRAIVLFHDYGHPRWPDVATVVDEWAWQHRDNVAAIGRVDDLVGFRWRLKSG